MTASIAKLVSVDADFKLVSKAFVDLCSKLMIEFRIAHEVI